MLKSLYVKNYAIIDELNIDFNSGFNVFTGETGAGKSIIVGALSFLIRGKADTSVIRTGQDKAIIEGIFSIEDYMKDSLKENDIDFYDELIIRRVISKDGHNSIKINQCSVTLNYLVDLFDEHIDIHSQKDSQYLLNKKNHLSLLDRYCDNSDLLHEYKDKYSIYTKALSEYNELLNNTYNESELEYINFDYKELCDANLNVEEEITLQDKEKRYKSAEKYITTLTNSIGLFDEDNGVKQNLKLLIKELNLDDKDIEQTRTNIENLYYSLEDEVSKLRSILSSFTDDDLDINKIEERLYIYSKLKRKHGLDVQGLIGKQSELKDKIKFFENKDVVLKEKKDSVDKLYNECLTIANKIHEIRSTKAKQLEKDIIKQTEDLMLNNVQFNVKIDKVDINANGIDNVEFYVSLNKGEDLKPLKDVASGGEISRLMLALKTIFTSLSDCVLAIFDEIDSGVSGKVGLAMGQKMKSISKNTQVLAITHLAPVAACGDAHYFIYKQDDSEASATHIKQLNNDEIINELASISSTDTSDKAIAAAKELYKLAQE